MNTGKPPDRKRPGYTCVNRSIKTRIACHETAWIALNMLPDSHPPEPRPGPPPGSMFLSLPVLERLEVLLELKASLNQLPSLDDLAASFLEQRQQATQPSPSKQRIRVLEASEAPPLAACV